MAGIYIHIPFCRSKCSYCDFYSVARLSLTETFTNSLCKEIEKKAYLLNKKEIRTIYFGGGTPSVLSIKQVETIFSAIDKHYDLSVLEEVSFEMNPEDTNQNYLNQLKKTPVNRLSIGVQSLQENILSIMKRRHTVNSSINAILEVANAGFHNLSIDLIYGVQNLTDLDWEKTIYALLINPVKHLSAYSLTIEEKTILHKHCKNDMYRSPTDEQIFKQYEILIQVTKELGYSQYEISNFAIPGYKSIHNSSYWSDDYYLGFGPSAHSFLNGKRFWNKADLNLYMKNINNIEDYIEEEELSDENIHNEYLMKRLRTTEGFRFTDYTSIFGNESLRLLKTKLDSINEKYIFKNSDELRLTTKGLFISDTIISSLMK